MYINLVCIATQSLHTTVVQCSSTDELVIISATSKPIVDAYCWFIVTCPFSVIS